MCPSDAADSFQGEVVVHAMLSDQQPLHHYSSSATPGCSGALIAVVLGRVNQQSSFQDITTCLKRLDGSANAPVVTLDVAVQEVGVDLSLGGRLGLGPGPPLGVGVELDHDVV